MNKKYVHVDLPKINETILKNNENLITLYTSVNGLMCQGVEGYEGLAADAMTTKFTGHYTVMQKLAENLFKVTNTALKSIDTAFIGIDSDENAIIDFSKITDIENHLKSSYPLVEDSLNIYNIINNKVSHIVALKNVQQNKFYDDYNEILIFLARLRTDIEQTDSKAASAIGVSITATNKLYVTQLDKLIQFNPIAGNAFLLSHVTKMQKSTLEAIETSGSAASKIALDKIDLEGLEEELNKLGVVLNADQKLMLLQFKDNFGFDNSTVALMGKLMKNIDATKNLKNIKVYYFFRIMGEFAYPQKGFDYAAGYIDEVYIIEYLGLSQDEYESLKNAIVDQHNNPNGQGDFAHMCIAIASCFQSQDIAEVGSKILGYGNIENATSWLGDIALPPNAMDNSDYIADLDAINLAYRIKNSDEPYSKVVSDYYAGIEDGSINRAYDFVTNMGENEATFANDTQYEQGTKYIKDKLSGNNINYLEKYNADIDEQIEIDLANCFMYNLYNNNQTMLEVEDWKALPDEEQYNYRSIE